MEKKFVVRDLRKKEKFQIDDAYLNGYARLCGSNATLVYLCLCRHADYHTQECFPSVNMMAEKLGIGRDSVMSGLKVLVEWNIVLKERTRHPKTAKWVNNSYTLLDKSVWKDKPSRLQRHGEAKSEIDPSQVDFSGKSQVDQIDCKDTHKSKDTHIEGNTYLQSVALQEKDKVVKNNILLDSNDQVNKLLDVFHSKGILQSFANKTYRQSAKELIDKYGFDGAKKLAEYAISILGQEYAPTINNPYELKNKLGSLNAFIKKAKTKSSNYIKI